MTSWAYRWLPIVFGCHCKKERSFHHKGTQFPICARCTGELVGILTGLVCCFFFRPPMWICILFLIPMVVDGFAQQLTAYESTNTKRVITGLLFGFGLWMLFAISIVAVFRLGMLLGNQWNI